MHDFMDETWLLNPSLRSYGSGDGIRTIELDDRDGRTLRLSVSDEAYALLQRFLRPVAWSAVRDELRTTGTDGEALARIERFLCESCVARRILVRPDADTHAHAQPTRPSYMVFMLELLGSSLVNRVSALLAPLFSPPLLIAGGLVALAGLASMFQAIHALAAMPAIGAPQALQVIGLCMLGVLLHELGHAAAAFRLGARRVAIGVGWYAVLPVAYADLSEVWRYPARQRVVVDLAGVHMQGLLVAALMLLDRLWPDPAWLVAAAATSMSMLWNLNPLLRMDGYWIVADAFGIPDLRRRAALELNLAVRRILGGERPSDAGGSPLIAVYGLLCAAFFLVLLARALAFLVQTAAVSLPAAWQRLDAARWSLSLPEWILLALGAAWNMLLVLFLLRVAASLVRRFAAWRASA